MDTLKMHERLMQADMSEDLANAVVDMFRFARFRSGDVAQASEWDAVMRSRLVGAGASYELAEAIVEVHRMARESSAQASAVDLAREDLKLMERRFSLKLYAGGFVVVVIVIGAVFAFLYG